MFAVIPTNAGVKWVDRGLVTSLDYDKDDFIKDSVWHEKDLSAKIGKGVKHLCVMIEISSIGVAEEGMYLRTHSQEGTLNLGAILTRRDEKLNEHDVWVLTDADGKIDYLLETATYPVINFLIRGWFE